MPAALAMAAPVQWVASCGGSVAVSATTRSMTSWPSGGTRERPGLVAQQAVDPFLGEAFLPAPDAGLRLARPAHDLDGAEAVRRQAARSRPARHASEGRCGCRRSPPGGGDRRR